MDTGANFMLIPRDNCTNCNAEVQHNLYKPSQSSTFRNEPGTFLQTFFGSYTSDEQEGANCTIVSDTVRMAGREALNQQFVACYTYSGGLREMPSDGIFGLGSTLANHWGPSPSDPEFKAVYWQLVENGALTSPEFSFLFQGDKQNTRDGVLTLGGTDKRLYHPETLVNIPLDWPLSESRNRWVIPIDGVHLPNSPLLPNTTNNVALVDTGTTDVVTPDFETAAAIYTSISPEITRIQPQFGLWGAKCDVVDRVAQDVCFTLGAPGSTTGRKDVVLRKEYFNRGPVAGMPGYCSAVFIDPVNPAREPNQHRPAWIVGNTLLRSYYTVWNGVERTLGWAMIHHKH